MIRATIRGGIAVAALLALTAAASAQDRAAFDALVSRHAAANGLPEALVHRVIVRESRYNPRAISKGNYGLMQIRLGTARAMGYRGGVEGLLDADTNMTYAVKYLAGAYRAAGGNHDRAVMNYARGYYYEAKRQGFDAYSGAPLDSRPGLEAFASSGKGAPQAASEAVEPRATGADWGSAPSH